MSKGPGSTRTKAPSATKALPDLRSISDPIMKGAQYMRNRDAYNKAVIDGLPSNVAKKISDAIGSDKNLASIVGTFASDPQTGSNISNAMLDGVKIGKNAVMTGSVKIYAPTEANTTRTVEIFRRGKNKWHSSDDSLGVFRTTSEVLKILKSKYAKNYIVFE